VISWKGKKGELPPHKHVEFTFNITTAGYSFNPTNPVAFTLASGLGGLTFGAFALPTATSCTITADVAQNTSDGVYNYTVILQDNTTPSVQLTIDPTGDVDISVEQN
jgi:hypothetical protein